MKGGVRFVHICVEFICIDFVYTTVNNTYKSNNNKLTSGIESSRNDSFSAIICLALVSFRRRGRGVDGDATGEVATPLLLLLAISLSSPNTIGSDDDDANRKMRESILFMMIDVLWTMEFMRSYY